MKSLLLTRLISRLLGLSNPVSQQEIVKMVEGKRERNHKIIYTNTKITLLLIFILLHEKSNSNLFLNYYFE